MSYCLNVGYCYYEWAVFGMNIKTVNCRYLKCLSNKIADERIIKTDEAYDISARCHLDLISYICTLRLYAEKR